MKLLFALGNSGANYTGTRHNAGFSVLDALANEYTITFSEKAKFKAHVGEMTIDGEKVLLAKPTTFYNHVGESYRAICDFYKIEPVNTLIIHDELALPFGTVRARIGGSDAGNNGIKSLNQYGGELSGRIRIGIANEQRAVIGDTDFVLGRFSKNEVSSFKTLVAPITTMIHSFIEGTFEVTTHNGTA